VAAEHAAQREGDKHAVHTVGFTDRGRSTSVPRRSPRPAGGKVGLVVDEPDLSSA
jgi:hypothetical protein